jgi:3-oxoacyl-[acyl-carrier protein] reductase
MANISSNVINKTCVITGAGSGIGRAAAIAVSKDATYNHIALIGRNMHVLEETKAMIISDLKEKPKKVSVYSYDLGELEGIPGLVDAIYDENKGIHCLMNIAGYTDPQPLLTTSLENMQNTYNVNVIAPLLLIRECVKYMKNNRMISKIINIASTAGTTPRPGWVSYASSKAAMVSISDTLSAELAEYKIKVYCVSPGRCATALRRKLAPDEDQSKIMQPEEVGQIVCQLASENEHCLDGQNIIVRKT